MSSIDQPGVATAPEPAEIVFQAAGGYVLSTALQAALHLNVADLLAAGPRDVADLARSSNAHEDALYRILRLLASVGIFTEVEPRRFALTPAADLLRRDHPASMRDMAEWFCDPTHLRIYADVMHTMGTGQPAAEKTLGMPIFEYFRSDPELSSLFNRAMTTFSASVMPAALEAYDFGGIGTLVDVAGGHGHVLLSILARYPAMRGVLLDLDHVVEGARSSIRAAGLEGRCEAVAGDFFTSVPAGDAHIMKHIIHDWDDDRAVRILENIHRAQEGRSGGRVILLESVLQPGNAPDLGKLVDIEMLMLPGGRERSADEFAALFARAGYELTRIVPTQSPLQVIEAVRRG